MNNITAYNTATHSIKIIDLPQNVATLNAGGNTFFFFYTSLIIS